MNVRIVQGTESNIKVDRYNGRARSDRTGEFDSRVQIGACTRGCAGNPLPMVLRDLQGGELVTYRPGTLEDQRKPSCNFITGNYHGDLCVQERLAFSKGDSNVNYGHVDRL